MYTYSYSYKNIPDEPIGKVKASSYNEALKQVSDIKKLAIEDTVDLFLIKQDK